MKSGLEDRNNTASPPPPRPTPPVSMKSGLEDRNNYQISISEAMMRRSQ